MADSMSDKGDAPLPPGWTKVLSNSQQRHYFCHIDTQHAQWHFPTDLEVAEREGKKSEVKKEQDPIMDLSSSEKAAASRRSKGNKESKVEDTILDQSSSENATTSSRTIRKNRVKKDYKVLDLSCSENTLSSPRSKGKKQVTMLDLSSSENTSTSFRSSGKKRVSKKEGKMLDHSSSENTTTTVTSTSSRKEDPMLDQSSRDHISASARSSLKSSTTKKIHYFVTFGDVQIREFERIAGFHPDTKEGPSLGISWKSRQKKIISVANYEHDRMKTGEKVLMPLNAETRRFILSHIFNVPKEKLLKSEKAAQIVQKQRDETYQEWKRDCKANFSQELCAKLADFPDPTVKATASDTNNNETLESQETKARRSFLSDVRKSLLKRRVNQEADMRRSV